MTQIDARKLSSMRRRTFTAAGKALAALMSEATAHQEDLDAGRVPPPAGLRKAADGYFRLLGTLDLADMLLTPESLEAASAPGDGAEVTVSRGDLALLTAVIAGGLPAGEAVNGNTPLGRLRAAAGPGDAPAPPVQDPRDMTAAEMAEAAGWD